MRVPPATSPPALLAGHNVAAASGALGAKQEDGPNVSSAQVKHHSTGRMAAAGATPSARDRREFALMGQEKIEAGVESAQAMAAHMMTMSQPRGALAFRHMMRNSSAFMSLASSRTPSQLIARQ